MHTILLSVSYSTDWCNPNSTPLHVDLLRYQKAALYLLKLSKVIFHSNSDIDHGNHTVRAGTNVPVHVTCLSSPGCPQIPNYQLPIQGKDKYYYSSGNRMFRGGGCCIFYFDWYMKYMQLI